MMSMLEKIQDFSFDQSYKTGAIHVKVDGPALEENNLLRCWGCLFLLNWIRILT